MLNGGSEVMIWETKGNKVFCGLCRHFGVGVIRMAMLGGIEPGSPTCHTAPPHSRPHPNTRHHTRNAYIMLCNPHMNLARLNARAKAFSPKKQGVAGMTLPQRATNTLWPRTPNLGMRPKRVASMHCNSCARALPRIDGSGSTSKNRLSSSAY